MEEAESEYLQDSWKRERRRPLCARSGRPRARMSTRLPYRSGNPAFRKPGMTASANASFTALPSVMTLMVN